ncbi:hypothetical protein BpHYR1_032890 [Brachionus plicatilis]|uniref:Uncharacterized protein n=1 Tax=Brachionus plicatilis TaxID=10195 RepID=A0A3M7QLI0_BRAPC|nr:hypothetical protein BpHYR1_032890 [Brachionus plicatilis]
MPDFYTIDNARFNPEKLSQSLFVQVLHARDHWVVVSNYNPSYVDSDDGYYNWFLYDSFPVARVEVSKQKGTKACGLFALGYSLALAMDIDPGQLVFDRNKIRGVFSEMILVDLDALIPNICPSEGHNLVKFYNFFIKNTPKCSEKSEESENNSIKSKKSLSEMSSVMFTLVPLGPSIRSPSLDVLEHVYMLLRKKKEKKKNTLEIQVSQSCFIVDRAVSWRLAPVELAQADSALFLPPPLPSVPPLVAPTRPSSFKIYFYPYYMNDSGNYQFEYFEEAQELIRVIHNTWIRYSSCSSMDPIQEWYCDCKADSRVFGACSHVTSSYFRPDCPISFAECSLLCIKYALI